MKRREFLAAGGALAATSVLTPSAFGQAAWPAGKPINIVVPVATGSSSDQVARGLAAVMQRKLAGSTVVVKNAGPSEM